MTNEALRHRVDALLESVHGYIAAVAEARGRRAALLATAEEADGRVAVTVNADGVVIDVEFAEDIGDLEFPEIAAAVRDAARRAAEAVARESAAMMRAVATPAGLPDIAEILPGLPDFATLRGMFPTAPRPSAAPPESPSRSSADRRPPSTVKDSGW